MSNSHPYNTYPYNQPQFAPLSAAAQQANEIRARLNNLLVVGPEGSLLDFTLERAVSCLSAEEWRRVAVTSSDRSLLVKAVANEAIVQDDLQFFDLGHSLEHLDFWQSNLEGDAFQKLIESFSSHPEIIRWLSERAYARLYDGIYAKILERIPSPDLLKKVRDNLRSIQTAEWERDLSSPSARIQLLVKIPELNLGIAFGNALSNLGESAVSKNSESSIATEPERLLSSMSEEAKAASLSKFASAFSFGTGPFGRSTIVWGEFIRRALCENGPEKTQERFVDIVKRSDDRELKWLASLIEVWRDDRRSINTIKILKKTTSQSLAGMTSPSQASALSSFVAQLKWRLDRPK